MPTREEAWNLLCEWTEGDSLRKHARAVEHAMRTYARKYGEDEEKWGVVGMLHDFDYERYPDQRHPLARRLHRRQTRKPHGTRDIRRRRAVRFPRGLRARPPRQELRHARSLVGQEADQRQSLRPLGQPQRPVGRRRRIGAELR